MSCILGDEMGLGKTLQTLSLLAWLQENTPSPHAYVSCGLSLLALCLSSDSFRPHLVICPLSVLSSWISEAKQWVPDMKVIRFHGSANERSYVKNSLKSSTHDFTKSGFDIMITTYEAFTAEDSWFRSRRWSVLILDEGHKIKNSEAFVSTKVQTVGAIFRLSRFFSFYEN
jgi:SWI/SNF-related matrix-associated actin-dependent regulator of chromatin subfamily A member 5